MRYANTYDEECAFVVRDGDSGYLEALPWEKLSGEQREMYRRCLPAWTPPRVNCTLERCGSWTECEHAFMCLGDSA